MTPVLAGQLVVVLGGSAGIGLATARAARAQGAGVVITGRDPDRLQAAAQEIGARHSAAFDADDTAAWPTSLSPCPPRSTTCTSPRAARTTSRPWPCIS